MSGNRSSESLPGRGKNGFRIDSTLLSLDMAWEQGSGGVRRRVRA